MDLLQMLKAVGLLLFTLMMLIYTFAAAKQNILLGLVIGILTLSFICLAI